jgi:hypothetical protein
VFWDLPQLSAGDLVTVRWRDQEFRYRVVNQCWIERTSREFDALVRVSNAEMLTIMAAGGEFTPATRPDGRGTYSHLRIIRAEREPGSIAPGCPAGGPPPANVPPYQSSNPRRESRTIAATVAIESLSERAPPGAAVILTARTEPNVRCRLGVFFNNVAVQAGFVEADDQGLISKTWTLRETIQPGQVRIGITCGAEVVWQEMTVTS